MQDLYPILGSLKPQTSLGWMTCDLVKFFIEGIILLLNPMYEISDMSHNLSKIAIWETSHFNYGSAKNALWRYVNKRDIKYINTCKLIQGIKQSVPARSTLSQIKENSGKNHSQMFYFPNSFIFEELLSIISLKNV